MRFSKGVFGCVLFTAPGFAFKMYRPSMRSENEK